MNHGLINLLDWRQRKIINEITCGIICLCLITITIAITATVIRWKLNSPNNTHTMPPHSRTCQLSALNHSQQQLKSKQQQWQQIQDTTQQHNQRQQLLQTLSHLCSRHILFSLIEANKNHWSISGLTDHAHNVQAIIKQLNSNQSTYPFQLRHIQHFQHHYQFDLQGTHHANAPKALA